MENGAYIYSKEIDWSALTDGITLPQDAQNIFARNGGTLLRRGEKRSIKLMLNGKIFSDAVITNVDFSEKYKDSHKNDILQIRYGKNSPFGKELQLTFKNSFSYFEMQRPLKRKGTERVLLCRTIKKNISPYTPRRKKIPIILNRF